MGCAALISTPLRFSGSLDRSDRHAEVALTGVRQVGAHGLARVLGFPRAPRRRVPPRRHLPQWPPVGPGATGGTTGPHGAHPISELTRSSVPAAAIHGVLFAHRRTISVRPRRFLVTQCDRCAPACTRPRRPATAEPAACPRPATRGPSEPCSTAAGWTCSCRQVETQGQCARSSQTLHHPVAVCRCVPGRVLTFASEASRDYRQDAEASRRITRPVISAAVGRAGVLAGRRSRARFRPAFAARPWRFR